MILKKLFEEFRVGNMELQNRIVMTALHLGYADENGFVTDRMIDFYTQRAKGGVGLIIVGTAYIETLGHDLPYQLGIDRDELIPRLRDMTSIVQKHGAKICCQIGHGGRYSHPDLCGDHPVAPSPVPAPIFTAGIIPRELSMSEIRRIVEKFGEAASRAKESGFDSVEVGASGGTLISQFLSPVTNRRTDRYGGELENRMRFLLEIIDVVRGKVGKEYPIICRICGNDMVPGGHTLKEQTVVAERIAKGGVDCINVNIGWEEAPYPMLQMVVPRGSFVFLAHGIKSAVQVPVIGGIGVNDPRLGEILIREEMVDLVGMARALIADPELPRKAIAGRFEDIRMCVHCNQGCLDTIFKRPATGVTCLVNVQAGREKAFDIQPASKKRKVIVIGGGPAGAEAARVSALRGHDVHLYESKDKLGGTLNIAAIPPGKGELNLVPEYYSTQLLKLGVKVYLNAEATPELVEKEQPDVVVVATGALPSVPKFPVHDGANIVNAEDVLLGRVEVGNNVAVVGGGGTGCDTALFLAKKGTLSPDSAVFLASSGILPCDEAVALTQRGSKSITILEMLAKVGQDIGPNMRFVLLQDLKRHGVRILTNTTVEEVTLEGVVYTKEGKKELLKADTIVIACGYKPNNKIYQKLQGRVAQLYLIGDSKEPQRAIDAIKEGFITAQQI